MKKNLILTGGLILISLSAFAKGTITGKVVDKESRTPIDYATVQIIDANSKRAMALGGTTDENGVFTLTEIPDGKYIIRVTNMGSVPNERNAVVAGKDVNLGEIILAEDAKMLQEVVVEGVRAQMKFDLDKRVFNVDANVISAGQSASELLESIPSVEVDQDGEVSLRGDTSVMIWINGRESGLTADNRAQILEQIPGETIEKIEVITNPSAKYSPEGTSGIINIVLKKDRRGGYFGSAELGANTRGGGNANASFNYNNAYWDTYASLGFRMRHNKGGSWSRRDYTNGSYLYSDGESPSHGNNIFFRLGATYHLGLDDDFTISGYGMFGHRYGKSITDYHSNIPGSWIRDYHLSRNNSDNRGGNVEFAYTHRFAENHTLDASIGYNIWGGPMRNSYLQELEYESGEDTDDIYQEQKQEINVKNVEAKVDYSIRLSKVLKLEAGYNGNFNHENSPVTTWSGTCQSDMQIDQQLYNRFIYDNNINSLYATLGGNAGKFSFSAGVRAEYWQTRTRSLGYGQVKDDVEQYKKNKFSLFPSAFLSYSLPYDNEVQVNYTRRIRRPWGGQLNSFRDISNPTNISYGNPELDPQYTNAFELNYIKTWTNHMISVSAYLRTADNLINRISYMSDNVLYSTWANVSKQANFGAEIVAKNNFFRNMLNLTTTVNLYRNHLSAWTMNFMHEGEAIPVSGNGRTSFAWDARCMASVKLPWSLSLQVTGSYRSRTLTAQGSREAGWNVDAGIRKSVGDWSFSVNCRDIFDSRKMNMMTIGPDYTQHNKHWRGGRTVRFTVKYSFGNMKPKRNKLQDSEPVDGSGYGGDMM